MTTFEHPDQYLRDLAYIQAERQIMEEELLRFTAIDDYFDWLATIEDLPLDSDLEE